MTTAAIGDTVLLSGIIADLRAALPAAALTLRMLALAPPLAAAPAAGR